LVDKHDQDNAKMDKSGKIVKVEKTILNLKVKALRYWALRKIQQMLSGSYNKILV
jgi:methionyl-tRNA synthetase